MGRGRVVGHRNQRLKWKERLFNAHLTGKTVFLSGKHPIFDPQYFL